MYKYINYFKICVCCKQNLIIISLIKFESMLALSITTLLRWRKFWQTHIELESNYNFLILLNYRLENRIDMTWNSTTRVQKPIILDTSLDTALKLYETKEIWPILQQIFYLIYSIFYLMSVQSFSNIELNFLIKLPQ